MASSRCLVLFTKPAVAGHVKTRLIGELTAEQAAELHAAFLGDLLERLQSGGFDLRIAWAVEESEPLPPSPVAAFRQRGAGLGERLLSGLRTAAEGGHETVAAVGSDHPDLPVERVEEAFRRLEAGAPLVLGPATDGGYYLIGCRAAALRPELFDGVPWSSPRVLERTLDACGRLGFSPSLLPSWFDVDEPEDLEHLAAAIAGDGSACPRTHALLRSWRRL